MSVLLEHVEDGLGIIERLDAGHFYAYKTVSIITSIILQDLRNIPGFPIVMAPKMTLTPALLALSEVAMVARIEIGGKEKIELYCEMSIEKKINSRRGRGMG